MSSKRRNGAERRSKEARRRRNKRVQQRNKWNDPDRRARRAAASARIQELLDGHDVRSDTTRAVILEVAWKLENRGIAVSDAVMQEVIRAYNHKDALNPGTTDMYRYVRYEPPTPDEVLQIAERRLQGKADGY
ncbi:hypothetical protein FH609_029410 [Streptomyces sp. 3MP-14]|uniref:Uncharacterized protein n=1 Tax=Streptomyces mimosae TaxID=2586635 RepID=A0A5N5ZUD1_9ACTN|nr:MULTISPECIES: hypothetical protein [Streptomyces]KAB8159463.1 hypothetical protein FH607_028405 [Streptomyces mimosae]KAB8172649.1 hypothetical protein FH609_029410 [Streptomyces sp. 3MP-14]